MYSEFFFYIYILNNSKNARKHSPSPEYTTPTYIPDELSSEPRLEDLNIEDDNATLVYKNAIAGIGSSAQRSSQFVKVRRCFSNKGFNPFQNDKF